MSIRPNTVCNHLSIKRRNCKVDINHKGPNNTDRIERISFKVTEFCAVTILHSLTLSLLHQNTQVPFMGLSQGKKSLNEAIKGDS